MFRLASGIIRGVSRSHRVNAVVGVRSFRSTLRLGKGGGKGPGKRDMVVKGEKDGKHTSTGAKEHQGKAAMESGEKVMAEEAGNAPKESEDLSKFVESLKSGKSVDESMKAAGGKAKAGSGVKVTKPVTAADKSTKAASAQKRMKTEEEQARIDQKLAGGARSAATEFGWRKKELGVRGIRIMPT